MKEDVEPGKSDRLQGLFGAARPEASFGLERKIGMEMVLAGLDKGAPVATQIGRYVIREKIGEGGMGAVYRVEDPELERSVALKVMRVLTSASQRKAIMREARALAKLAHPNVVTVHDMGVADGQLYVTMEYVPGRTLRDWLSEATTRGWREIVRIFLDAGAGLSAAHQVDIVHRDFKPENVLIGHDARVRVVDFGLARRTFAATDASASETATIVGTPQYMAPEARETGRVTAASDQYSFCRALGEALEGRVEGAGREDEPSALWEVVTRGTAEAPDQRFPDMEAVLAALDRILVTPVTDGDRETLLARMEEVWSTGASSSALIPSELVPLPLVHVPEHVPRPREPSAFESSPGLTDTRRLARLLALAEGSLLILGQPGAGKSTSILQLAGQLLEQARRDTSKPIPLLLNLASFGDSEQTIVEWIQTEALTRYGIPERRTRRRLEGEAWILLLDGLDEVASDRRARCVEEINRFRGVHPCPVVVACREQVYVELGVQLDLRAAVKLDRLDHERRAVFLERLGPVGESLSRQLERDPERQQHLQTPLLLTLAALSGSAWSPEDSETRLRAELYRHFLDETLSPERDDDRAMLDPLRWLARAMRDRSLTELWVERLQADWLPSRTAQVLARGLGLLLVVAVLLGGTLLATVFSERSVRDATVIGFGCVPVVLLFNRGLQIRPLDKLRWSGRKTLYWLPRVAGIGAVAGAIFGLFYILWFNALAGLMAGVIVSLPMGLESSDEVTQLRPNRTIRRSLLNGLVVGSVTGVIAGISWGWVLTPLGLPYLGPESLVFQTQDPVRAAFATGLAAIGSLTGMAAGGTAVVLHGALRVVLAATTPLPLRLITFLEKAADRGLLRRVGGGYVFPHRTLQDFLATQQAD